MVMRLPFSMHWRVLVIFHGFWVTFASENIFIIFFLLASNFHMPFSMSNYLRTDKKHCLWFSTDFVSFCRQQRQKKSTCIKKTLCQIGAITHFCSHPTAAHLVCTIAIFFRQMRWCSCFKVLITHHVTR